MEKQNRFKSKVVWTSVIAQIIVIGQLTGLFAKIGLDAGLVGDVCAAVLQLFVLFGVLNDPTNKTGF